MRFIAAAAAVVLTAVASPAYAIDQSKGKPGFCPSATGVTVVVDFQDLGGTTIVRCFPSASRGTGLDALKGAGFQIAGVQRWGEGFICRVENRPSAVEIVPAQGKQNYRELCIDTPPGSAYWSYWHAGNNCPWVYSQWGIKNRDFIPGGFEGWSFSLNKTAKTNPQPRIAAVRPGAEGRTCNATEEPKPTTNDPNEQQQPQPNTPPGADNGGGDGDPPAAEPPPAPATSAALPLPRPRNSASPTAANPALSVAFTGGEQAEDVNKVLRRQSGASPYAPWVAGAAVVLLAAASWWIARQRRRARKA
ncbi:hypothetical protein Ais01nite_73380 [Asanoa ishikariensis]|nr:hypothetical protein Ais01nite_73380 [Asanoa ishikariensis]